MLHVRPVCFMVCSPQHSLVFCKDQSRILLRSVLHREAINFAAKCRVATLPAKDVPAQVKAVVAWAWLTTFLICSIVPIDVYSTLRSQDPDTILTLWDISYWSTQLLTWLLIPLYMGYAAAGEFTWRGRMWASARSNGALAFLMVRT